MLSKEDEVVPEVHLQPDLGVAWPAPLAPLPQHKWYAAFTNSHHEKRVAEQLTQRHFECFLPLYRTTHRWKNRRKVELQLPLFPNYVFVHLDLTRPVRLYEIRGLVGLVGPAKQPAVLQDFEIESLRSGLHLRRIEPCAFLTIGDRVRIKAGALAGWEGILVRKKNEFRVVLSLDTIMKSIAVEVNSEDIEPVGPPHGSSWAI